MNFKWFEFIMFFFGRQKYKVIFIIKVQLKVLGYFYYLFMFFQIQHRHNSSQILYLNSLRIVVFFSIFIRRSTSEASYQRFTCTGIPTLCTINLFNIIFNFYSKNSVTYTNTYYNFFVI